MSDTDTTTDAAATDEQIGWLIDTYGAVLYPVAVAVVGNRELAEDVVQEVLVKAWTSMPSWDGDVPIKWARVVTKNTAISALRSANTRPFKELDPDHGDFTTGSIDDDYIRDEHNREMWAVRRDPTPPGNPRCAQHTSD